MAKNFMKSLGGKSAIKQVKGPGMNLGLKKPRKNPPKPKDYVAPRTKKAAAPGSYLPDSGFGGKKF